jgi:rhodanese-related sulfurtransferase
VVTLRSTLKNTAFEFATSVMDEVEARLQEIPRDRPVVPYCNMQHPGLSRGERVTALLLGKGYEARVLDGGFLKWQEELPIAKDEC